MAAVFIGFAAVHSLLVTDQAKSLGRSLFGERAVRAFYRLFYTVLGGASTLAALCLILLIPNETILSPPLWMTIPFHLIQLAGLAIGAAAFRRMNLGEFLGIAQAMRFLEGKEPQGDEEGLRQSLVTTGIYGALRHPQYLAGILIFTFNPYITRTWLVVSLLADLYFVVGALLEERRLLRRFGEDYRLYMERVPRFVPRLRGKGSQGSPRLIPRRGDRPHKNRYNGAMKKELTLGYSPCPNDTFIFYALVRGRIETGGLSFRETLEDVETLNRMAMRGVLDVTKVSTHALGFLRENYCLLRSGGALGRGCGPLIVAREPLGPRDLRGKRIAIPGALTTAYLLMRLFDPMLKNVEAMPFHRIMDAVSSGSVDAGLIIHEGRFTYPRYGLHEVADLGKWWEEATGLPIPLGSIAAKRALGAEVIDTVDALVRESLLYAQAHPEETMGYIKEHSQELDDEVIRMHIDLYVNDFSLDLGDQGTRAVEEFLRRAEEKGLIERTAKPLFAR